MPRCREAGSASEGGDRMIRSAGDYRQSIDLRRSAIRSGGRRLGVLALAIVLVGFTAPAATASDDESTRAIMTRIVESLQVALPPSFDEKRFSDPANRERIATALRGLAADGASLERHAAQSNASFAFLSHSLAEDTRVISERYDAGRFEQARFLLYNLTEVCSACHSQLPDDRLRQLGRNLVRDEAIATLPPDERARYEVATRQFDPALSSLEEYFADPSTDPGSLELTGQFETYLEVSLRVKRDPDRALKTLRKFRQRNDVPDRVEANVDSWIAALEALKAAEPTGTPLEYANRQLETAAGAESVRDERDLLVTMIATSGDLHRFVTEHQQADAELGEAYYLLGAIDAEIGRSFWASQAAHFLETSIRIGPGEAYAPVAYELLEAFLVAGYTGSAGQQVPPEVTTRLQELAELINRSQPR